MATRVGAVRSVVCASPAYLAAHGTPATPQDLADRDSVSFDGLDSAGGWRFRAPGATSDLIAAIRARLTVNTAEAAIDAAIAGVGVTRVLSYQAAAAVADGRLKIILTDFERAPMDVSLIHAGQGRLPLKTRAFLDMAAPRLRRALAFLAT